LDFRRIFSRFGRILDQLSLKFVGFQRNILPVWENFKQIFSRIHWILEEFSPEIGENFSLTFSKNRRKLSSKAEGGTPLPSRQSRRPWLWQHWCSV